MIKACNNSECAKLESLVIHEPGAEVENMTPATAERALYSDILNLPIARDEYSQFKGVLEKVTNVVEAKYLLTEILKKPEAKQEIINKLESFSGINGLASELTFLSEEEITKKIIEGIPLPQVSLTNFLSYNRFAVNPLHNMFFMRDASFAINKTVYISSMAREVRKPEAVLLELLYKYSLDEESEVVFVNDRNDRELTIEGGDVHVVSSNVLMIGIGARTTPKAVDKLIKKVSEKQDLKYVLVQELPHEPESFIHLDMVFTLLSENECMVYKPVILEKGQFRSVLIEVDGGEVKKIRYVKNLTEGLKLCGFDYAPIFCGGGEPLHQEREQWHSGANFFAFEPGKIIGYARNIYTAEALNKHGYEVISATDVIEGRVSLEQYKKCLVTIEGAELARGGGGPRCMTMPLLRR